MSFQNDDQLIQGIQNFQEVAVKAVYLKYLGNAYSVLFAHGATKDLVEDIYIETMIEIIEKIQYHDLKPEYFNSLKQLITDNVKSRYSKYNTNIGENAYLFKVSSDEAPKIEVDFPDYVETGEKRLGKFEAVYTEIGSKCKSLIFARLVESKSIHQIMEKFHYDDSDRVEKSLYDCLWKVRRNVEDMSHVNNEDRRKIQRWVDRYLNGEMSETEESYIAIELKKQKNFSNELYFQLNLKYYLKYSHYKTLKSKLRALTKSPLLRNLAKIKRSEIESFMRAAFAEFSSKYELSDLKVIDDKTIIDFLKGDDKKGS